MRVASEVVALSRAAENLPADFLAAAAQLRGRSRFRPALAHYCEDMARESPMAWPIYKLFDQFHRYVACYMLIHNYYAWRHGAGPLPTLTALQRVSVSSARHTAGFIAALKEGGFVLVEADPADRRVKLLRPASAMVREIGRSVRLFVRAVDEIQDRRPQRAAALAEPDRLGGLLQRSAASSLTSGTLIHPFPRVLYFAERDCGYPLLTAVLGAHYAATVAGAPAAVPLSLRALARRFQVSRAHVGNLLDEASRQGWFETGRDGALVRLSPGLVDEFEQWSCWQMVHFDMLGTGP